MSIEIRGLNIAIGTKPIVRDVCMGIADGERVGLVGSSGSGKSMIAKALMGLLPDTARISGSIMVGGKQLIGLDDPDFTDGSSYDPERLFENKLQNMDLEPGFTILLSHRPELFPAYSASGIDLILSGHAHGGQFRIPFIGGVAAPNQGFFPKYDAGEYHESGTTMIVSRGIGNSVIPVRINNRPEVVMIELVSEE